MRHAVFGKKLSRDQASRKALLNNLASAILEKGELTTTLAKAKFAKSYVEKIVTVAKKSKLSKNRVLASTLTNTAFLKLINEIGPGFMSRNGGYTRIIKLNKRRGDNAQMARLEFVEWDKKAVKQTQSMENKSKKPKATKKTSLGKKAVIRKVKRQVTSKAGKKTKKGK